MDEKTLKEKEEIKYQEAFEAICSARQKLRFLCLDTHSQQYYEQCGGGYQANLPMGLCYIIDDIELQLELVENYFVKRPVEQLKQDACVCEGFAVDSETGPF